MTEAADLTGVQVTDELVSVNLFSSTRGPVLDVVLHPKRDGNWMIPASLIDGYRQATEVMSEWQNAILEYVAASGQDIPWPFSGYRVVELPFAAEAAAKVEQLAGEPVLTDSSSELGVGPWNDATDEDMVADDTMVADDAAILEAAMEAEVLDLLNRIDDLPAVEGVGVDSPTEELPAVEKQPGKVLKKVGDKKPSKKKTAKPLKRKRS